jgi:hypothetical protein
LGVFTHPAFRAAGESTDPADEIARYWRGHPDDAQGFRPLRQLAQEVDAAITDRPIR